MITRNDLECGYCGGDEFAYGVVDGKLKLSIYRRATIQGSVCLSCGHVFTYVDDADLNRLRSWKAKESTDA